MIRKFIVSISNRQAWVMTKREIGRVARKRPEIVVEKEIRDLKL